MSQGFTKPELLATFVDDMKSMQILMAAGMAEVDTNKKDAIAAKTALEGLPRMARLVKALRDSPVGIELMVPASQLENDSAAQQLGDTRFDMAIKCFADAAMLKVTLSVGVVPCAGVEEGEGNAKYMVSNAHLVLVQPMLLEPLLK